MHCLARFVVLGLLVLAAGCGVDAPPYRGASEPAKIRAADVSILFVGNSHTRGHDLPELICGMIRHVRPGKTTYSQLFNVEFLEDVARDGRGREEVECGPWSFVILQAQKISTSGKHEYSRAEGIEIARLAKARGSRAIFYPEWGLRGVPGDGPRQEAVYREMARESEAGIAPVARAWDVALAGKPELPLYEIDGNHQTAVGAFLTAAVLAGAITGESPTKLADYPYPAADAETRAYLAGSAAKAIAADLENTTKESP